MEVHLMKSKWNMTIYSWNKVMLKGKMLSMSHFQLLKGEDSMLFFVMFNCKQNIFEFWTVGRIKQYYILKVKVNIWSEKDK